MPRIISTWATAVVLLAGVGWFVAGPAASASADAITECSTTSGVIVAVDFSHWGEPVERGCDAALSTGYTALSAAGFATAGDVDDGPAFICRINDKPTSSEDPCVHTPPANAAWWYWHANAGQASWSLSELGAMAYHPQPGSVDAWTFGAMTLPSFSPSEIRANNPGAPLATTVTTRPATTTPAPRPTTAPTVAPGPPATTTPPPSSVAPSSSDPAATSGDQNNVALSSPTGAAHPAIGPATSAPTTTRAAAKASSQGSSTTTLAKRPKPSGQSPPASAGRAAPEVENAGAVDHSTPKIVDVSPQAAATPAPEGSGGSAAPTLIGVSVVGVLVAAGGVTGWRRRRRTG